MQSKVATKTTASPALDGLPTEALQMVLLSVSRPSLVLLPVACHVLLSLSERRLIAAHVTPATTLATAVAAAAAATATATGNGN